MTASDVPSLSVLRELDRELSAGARRRGRSLAPEEVSDPGRPLRVLIVSENISLQMGGESSLPFYYAKLLSQRGVEVWLACHERVEEELSQALPELAPRIRYVRDTRGQKALFKYGGLLPYRIRDMFVGQAIHVSSQARIRAIARELACEDKIDVVLEPAPITPKGLSFMYGIGVPVVIGPMCGGMNFPPAFQALDSFVTRQSMRLGRHASQLANRLVPGKLQADVLLVANESTERALPAGHRGRVIRLFESGVDLDIWKPSAARQRASAARAEVRFVFCGRFVDWKGVQYLVPALAQALRSDPNCRLELIGGGELEPEIRRLIAENGIENAVHLHGWKSRSEAADIMQKADVFVMPSLRECGGTAILEAMAQGLPVITTNWGGPADYVDARCGLLADPSSPQGFIDALAERMVQLAGSSELRARLGAGGRQRVREDDLEWGAKAERVLSILSDVVATRRPLSPRMANHQRGGSSDRSVVVP